MGAGEVSERGDCAFDVGEVEDATSTIATVSSSISDPIERDREVVTCRRSRSGGCYSKEHKSALG